MIYNSSEQSRCFSFSLLLTFARFCVRSLITTVQFDLVYLLLFSSLVSYHMTLDTSQVLFVMPVLPL